MDRIFGWGKPRGAMSYHFFFREAAGGGRLLESVCQAFHTKRTPWFWDPSQPLERGRDCHAEENCVGCRAWLLIPSNRRKLEAKVSA